MPDVNQDGQTTEVKSQEAAGSEPELPDVLGLCDMVKNGKAPDGKAEEICYLVLTSLIDYKAGGGLSDVPNECYSCFIKRYPAAEARIKSYLLDSFEEEDV